MEARPVFDPVRGLEPRCVDTWWSCEKPATARQVRMAMTAVGASDAALHAAGERDGAQEKRPSRSESSAPQPSSHGANGGVRRSQWMPSAPPSPPPP